jgi:hypothetical protein
MGGFSNAFWLWLPVLIFKAVSAFFRTLWKFNLWILQSISGVPLYYCKPEYRVPGIFVGTFGVISVFNFLFFALTLSYGTEALIPKPNLQLENFLLIGGI